MEQSNFPTYTPVEVLEVDREAGKHWKKAGFVFCENNGWDWEGNSYLLIVDWEADQITALECQLKDRNINFYEFTKQVPGYVTARFGFDDYETDAAHDFSEMAESALEICEKAMVELGIRWCGWSEAPSFSLVATEKQLQKLIKRLEQPIEEWKKKNKNLFPDIWGGFFD
jgi:hypothetical protein